MYAFNEGKEVLCGKEERVLVNMLMVMNYGSAYVHAYVHRCVSR